MVLSSNPRDTDPYQFDLVLKKLETTKSSRARTHTDSSRDTALSGSVVSDPYLFEQRNDDTNHNTSTNDHHDDINNVDSTPVPERQTSIENFIHQQTHAHEQADGTTEDFPNAPAADASSQSSNSGGGGGCGGSSSKEPFTRYEALQFLDHTNPTNGVAERNLPEAILRLDRRHAIPRPRHKNDVLIEIEASTVDKRDLMTRPGVRCSVSLPVAVETTCLDCIGRVVQLSTHARAIHGIEVDDRVAAIYPFEYKDEKSNNHQYTLVDAALVVNVPRNVDAAMASCMTRLYTTAFQAIQLGLQDLHDRYDLNQLRGKSLLVQDGDTELGRALIELAVELGASQIFATGPSGVHDRLRDMGATPLGAETFGWELFVEEKLSLVLVQALPTPETFESFMSLLGQDRSMVYVQPPNNINQDDHSNVIFRDDSFDAREFIHDLANKAKGAFVTAKFNCQLTCSQQFETYDGIWMSAKENQILFKKDLRFLLTLLSEGKLTPLVEERVCLEDVPGVQDRIELEGKRGTIVCLPTTLFEKKANMVGALKPKSKSNHPSSSQSSNAQNASPRSSQDLDMDNYAADSGYIRPNYDTLSDFNFLTPKPAEEDGNGLSQFLDGTTSFTNINSKSCESFVSIGNTFVRTQSDERFDNIAVGKKKEVADEDILQRDEENNDAEDELKSEVTAKTRKVESGQNTLIRREVRSKGMLNKRAQIALQRKKQRARMRKEQSDEGQLAKSSGSNTETVSKEVVEQEETQTTPTPSSSPPAQKEEAVNKSSDINPRPITRVNRPTPEWLKSVRPQTSLPPESSNTVNVPIKRSARPPPEWMNGTPRSQMKYTDAIPDKTKSSNPVVETDAINVEDTRDDDNVSISSASDFNSVMNKWKAVENRSA